jgi:hypothetical protein
MGTAPPPIGHPIEVILKVTTVEFHIHTNSSFPHPTSNDIAPCSRSFTCREPIGESPRFEGVEEESNIRRAIFDEQNLTQHVRGRGTRESPLLGLALAPGLHVLGSGIGLRNVLPGGGKSLMGARVYRALSISVRAFFRVSVHRVAASLGCPWLSFGGRASLIELPPSHRTAHSIGTE